MRPNDAPERHVQPHSAERRGRAGAKRKAAGPSPQGREPVISGLGLGETGNSAQRLHFAFRPHCIAAGSSRFLGMGMATETFFDSDKRGAAASRPPQTNILR